jgi:sugar phosphate isomerase/epimerase
VIDMAEALQAPSIRVYGGKLTDGEEDPDGRKLSQLIRSMRECGDYCAKHGDVKLSLENHFGTMTTTAQRSAEVIRAIGHPNVGVLYDQANIAFFPAEDYEEAIDLQRGFLYYVHCKDLVYRNGEPEKPVFKMVSHVTGDDRTVRSRIPGEGILDWFAILGKLKEIGYDGWVSLEYERRWGNQDLPIATDGMPRAAAYIRTILDKLS